MGPRAAGISRLSWLTGALLALLFWSGGVAAQYSGYYLELSRGDVETQVDYFPRVSPGGRSSEMQAEGSTWAVNLGVRFNDHVAVELNYSDHGPFSGPSSLQDTVVFQRLDPDTGAPVVLQSDVDVQGEGEFEASKVGVNLVGRLPLSRRWSLQGKVGLGAWRLDYEFMGQADFTGEEEFSRGLTRDQDDNGTNLQYAASLVYRFNLSYGVKLEYQRFDIDSQLFDSAAEFEALSLGARIYF